MFRTPMVYLSKEEIRSDSWRSFSGCANFAVLRVGRPGRKVQFPDPWYQFMAQDCIVNCSIAGERWIRSRENEFWPITQKEIVRRQSIHQ